MPHSQHALVEQERGKWYERANVAEELEGHLAAERIESVDLASELESERRLHGEALALQQEQARQLQAEIEAVNRFTTSQGSRLFTVSKAPSEIELSSPTPASSSMSSSCPSSSTFIASSMVMTPTRRPPASTTGQEIR